MYQNYFITMFSLTYKLYWSGFALFNIKSKLNLNHFNDESTNIQ